MERLLEIQLIICGIELQEPYEGNLFALKQCEVVDCSGTRLSNCVQFDYSITVKADPSICEQQYVNRVVNREVNSFLQSLSVLLMCPSHLIGYKAKLDRIAVEPEPSRQYAPSLYSLAEMFRRVPKPSGFAALPTVDFWNLLEYIICRYRQRRGSVSARLALSLRWFARGSNEFNICDRLVSFWISFNALYADPHIDNEQNSIKSYVDKNMDPIMAKHYADDNKGLLETLSRFPIELGRVKKQQIAQNLAELLKNNVQDYIDLARTTALTVYGIRNNLFHGAYNPDSESEQEQIATAEELLSSLVRMLIVKEMIGESPPPMKRVSQRLTV